MPRPETNNDWQDLKPLLDQELSKLPEKYREVIVLSDLQGHTRKEVAKALGVAEGTVASRLARARVILAKRLARRNLSISAGALASLLSENATADVPAALTATTARAATQLGAGRPIAGDIAILTDTIVRSLARSKAKIGAVIVVVLTVIGIGLGTLLPSVLADRKGLPEKFNLGAVKPEDKKDKPQEAKDCVLEAVDPNQRTIAAACPNDAAGESVIDLHVGPATRILLDGREGGFADLRAGMYVHLQWRADAAGRRQAVCIEVAGEVVPGIVQAMDDDTLTLRCENHKGEFIDKKYELDKASKVLINGKKAKLGDLKVKMRVTIQVPTGKTKAVGVKAAGPKVAGSVKAVHIDKRTLSLEVPDLHLVADGVTIAPDAAVMIAARKATLADVQAGMKVTVQMSAETEGSYVVAIICSPAGKK